MKTKILGLLAVGLLAGPVAADATVFSLNRTIGTGSVTGSITTDGTIGPLDVGNITDWTLVLNEGAETFTLLGPLSGANSELDLFLSGLSATATELVFDFAAPSFVAFQNPTAGSGKNFYCLQGDIACFDFLGAAEGVAVGPYSSFDVNTYARTAYQGRQVIGTISATVPEPASLALLGLGLAGLGLSRRRKAT